MSTVIYLSICRGGLYSLVILNFCITEKKQATLKVFCFYDYCISETSIPHLLQEMFPQASIDTVGKIYDVSLLSVSFFSFACYFFIKKIADSKTVKLHPERTW